MKASLADNQLHFDANATNSLGLQSQMIMDLPMVTGAAPFRLAVAGEKPLRGSFSLDGEIRPLFDLWAGGTRTLSGRAVAKGTIGGTLASMAWVGQGSLTGGRLQDVASLEGDFRGRALGDGGGGGQQRQGGGGDQQ